MLILIKDLNLFYNDNYKNKLNDYYIDLVGKRILNFIMYGIIYLIFLLVPSILFIIKVPIFKYKILIVVFYNIIILISYCFNVHFVNKKEYRNMNKKVLGDLIYYLNDGNEYFFKDKFRLKKELFKSFDIFNFDLLNYSGCNFSSISYKESEIICSDVDLFIYNKKIDKRKVVYNNKNYIKTTTKLSKNIIFKGFYMELRMNKVCDTYIYLIPNNINDKYLSSYINYYGERILLEDINFNKRYSVYSFDQIKSRYILSISLMDKINKLDLLISNKKYIVFKDDSTVGIFINNFSFNDILNTRIPIKRDSTIELSYLKSICDKVSVIFSIYDILDLNKDIYDIKN